MLTKSLRRMAGYADMARHASRMHRSDREQVRELARRHLIERMGKMRGLPQKLGQMLSFSGDEEDQAAGQYVALQESAEALPLEVVQPIIEDAWGCPLEHVLSDIEPEAHAASLGQVHRATHRDGRQLAVKIQYPGIREAVMSDLKLLGWLSIPVGNLRRGFDLPSYRDAILADLEEELDYRQEADHQRAFARWAENDSFLLVPNVVDDLSTNEVLVSTWEEGDHWSTVGQTWKQDERRKLAVSLLQFFLEGLFARGMMQADWHPGNVRFRRGPDGVQMLLYDFGCIYQPDNSRRAMLLRLIRATIEQNESPWPLFLGLGFRREYLEPLADKLPLLCRILFEPFCVEYPFDLAEWHLADRVSDVLGEDRWNFRIAGPPQMIFLLRAFHGLVYYMERLAAPVPWQRALAPHLVRGAEDMSRLNLPAHDEAPCDFSGLARYMKIRVRENGCTKVELTSYAWSVEHLEELLDADLCERIAKRGIDLAQIAADVRRRLFAPGPVFEMEEGQKQVEVWLE